MTLFGLAVISAVIQGILFVVLGEVTVRKLRKNPLARCHLGVDLFSGWDILSVSMALSRPRRWSELLESSRLAPLYACSSALRVHTTRFDRALARVHFCSMLTTLLLVGAWLAFIHFG